MPLIPKRFYTYLILDVLKQFAITALILVVVIAFGAAIKPLSSDQLISGWDTVKYLMLALVPMLQFAIPFSAAFATTLVLHRMSQDNEIVAIALCGQSYVRILSPVIAFGICLTISLVVLTQLVIPKFVGMMASAMTADLPRLLTQSIKQHTPFVQGDLVIWAEDIYLDQDNQDERMVLEHVAVAKRDQRGEAEMYLTASAALVDVERVDTASSMYVMAKDATQWTRGEGNAGILRGAKKTNVNQGIELPSIAHARPSSLTMFELITLKDNERRFPEVNRAASNLQTALQKQAILQTMSSLLESTNQIEFISQSGGRTFVLHADRIAGQN
ncbi:MAG: LptF/LptG family permease, partial [Phycisphaerales bacterium]|nr:LptF/LptG family permease [Phycisphaerales bacterium]